MGGDRMMIRLVLACSVLLSLFFTSSAQSCQGYTISSNREYTSCADLPQLNSFLHWNYDQTTGKLEVAYRHTGITSTGTWVAWAINMNLNSLENSMTDAQALVAVLESGGSPRVFTSPISSSRISTLTEGNLSFEVPELNATYQNNEVTIFATAMLPNNTASIIHLWQQGPVSDSSPQAHAFQNANLNSKGTLDLLSGQTTSGGNSVLRRRNTHAVLNAVSWGVLMPIGAIIARYLKVFKSADPAWFYLHVICQTSAYIVGVAGWGTGLKLGSDSAGITHDTHRALGITLFCLGTLQVFALLLRPNKDHKYRFYWNIYHYVVGYSVIIITIINVFEGFDILQLEDDKWKNAYIGVIAALGGIALILEVYTWILVLKRKNNTVTKHPQGANGGSVNGANGYGSRPQQV